MNRKEFLTLTTGIIGGLSIPGTFVEPVFATQPISSRGTPLDPSYLVKGLTAMARADGWFSAHWGAGVLAGYYLCSENRLSHEIVTGIKAQLDAVIEREAAQFAPLPQATADESLIERIPRALIPAMEGGLRAHGHAVIFASLSIKALRDAPQMAQPALIDALCDLSRQIAKKKPETLQGGSTPSPYPDTQTMIEATFDSLARFEGLLGRPSIRRPNFTHMTTHTEALMNLEEMGYPELAQAGHHGLRVHISPPVPEIPASTVASADHASLGRVMSEQYWNDKRNTERWNQAFKVGENPNGDWIASGHLFKVLYSYHRLIKRIPDIEKVKLCSKILLERYMIPEVQGG